MARISIAKWLCAIAFISIVTPIYLFHLNDYLTLSQIKFHKTYLQAQVARHYGISVLIYLLIYISLVALAMPAAGILTIAGGALFGTMLTSFYVCIGATAGAVIAFLASRYVLREAIEKRYGKYVLKFNNKIKKNGYSYMLVLRLVPIMPFFIINPLAGLTQLSLHTFIWTTALGILPGTIVFAAAGQRLSMLESVHDIISWQTGIILLLLATLSLIPAFFGGYVKKKV